MDAKSPAAATTYHALFISDGNTSFRWAITDSGITLSADGLSWTIDGNERARTYSDIFSIRLQRAAAGTGAGVGICEIGFRDGITLKIMGGSAHGIADAEKAPLYADFVRDLHKRLAARQDTSHIYYNAGLSQGRYTVLTIAIVASAILFGLLPLGLLIMIHDLHTLILFVTSGGLLWSFYMLWQKNRPRPYTPTSVPEELLS
jgi:hypothetical protein